MRLGFRRSPAPWASDPLAAVALATCLLTCCTFPDFVALHGGSGGSPDVDGGSTSTGGAGGANGASGGELGTSGSKPQGGTSTDGGAGTPNVGGTQAGNATGGGGSESGGGGSGDTSGTGGTGGTGGTPFPPDPGPCGERPQPTHCWNLKKDADETDVDCGGPRCDPCAAEETCSVNEDCGVTACESGKCARSFELSYVRHSPEVTVKTLGGDIEVKLVGSEPQLLRDVTVRYYFSRNGVAEPLLPGGSATQGGADISGDLTWKVVRQPRGNGITNDAYLEAGFTGGRVLSPGDVVTVSANLTAGDDEDSFNQGTHHSWDATATPHETKKISVQLKGHRVWGRGPLISDPPSCFHLGVNLDGTALTVAGHPWDRSPDSVLARYAKSDLVLKPATDAGSEEMLRAGFFFDDSSFGYAVPNGKYALLVYVWSADGGDTGTLSLNDEQRDRFHAQSFQGGSPWVPLGPYRIEITDGMLRLASQGQLRLGGLEFRLLDE
jgi:hypothetical protein